jgi:glutamate N-acetyltransferase/amino-acid N-acetyltransferase
MSQYPVSPLAPKSFIDPAPIEGVRIAVGAAGVRYSGRNDVLLMAFDSGAAVAGVFYEVEMPVGPGRVVQGASGEGRRQGARGQFR